MSNTANKAKTASWPNQFDLFAEPIYLHIKGRKELTTSLGGVLSIILILIIGYQAFIQTRDMIRGINANIVQLTEIEDIPAPIQFNHSNYFIFAIGAMIDSDVMPLNQSIFNISILYGVYTRTDNAPKNKTKIPIPLAPCKPHDFPAPLDPSIYANFSLKN